MNKLTVILPAAGKGQRLNLPYPKEILRINENTMKLTLSPCRRAPHEIYSGHRPMMYVSTYIDIDI